MFDERMMTIAGSDIKRKGKRHGIRTLLFLIVLAVLMTLTSCGSAGPADLSSYPEADMSGYKGLENYEGDLDFRELTVSDIKDLMEDKSSFAFYAGFSTCPWCNAMIATFAEVVDEEDITVGYLNTRADSGWTANTEIEGYDVFVELFGEFLELDEEDEPHLYVPDVYWIKDGKVVKEHQGLVEGIDEPDQKMTDAQREELMDLYRQGFKLIQ